MPSDLRVVYRQLETFEEVLADHGRGHRWPAAPHGSDQGQTKRIFSILQVAGARDDHQLRAVTSQSPLFSQRYDRSSIPRRGGHRMR